MKKHFGFIHLNGFSIIWKKENKKFYHNYLNQVQKDKIKQCHHNQHNKLKKIVKRNKKKKNKNETKNQY